MIGRDDLLAALEHQGRMLAACDPDPGKAWIALFEALGLDPLTVARQMASIAINQTPSAAAYAQGLTVGVIAGRRDAAECMAVPS